MTLIRLYILFWIMATPAIRLALRQRAKRGKENLARLPERYGYTNTPRPQGTLFWLHAASVGEAVSAYVLANAILSLRSDSAILITTATLTSAKMLDQRINADNRSGRILHQMQPLDHPRWIDRFLDHWKPQALVTLESDIWPVMVLKTRQRKIPVAMMSAQISDRSMKRWGLAGSGLRQRIFSAFTRIDAADDENRSRFESLIKTGWTTLNTGGPLKAAAPPPDVDPDIVRQIKEYAQGRFVLLLASSHTGEDELVVDAIIRMKRDSSLLLLIAPRHVKDAPAIAAMLEAKGYRAPRLSRDDRPEQDQPFWIADRMGIMGSLVTAADLVIMGGGFRPFGGHNPMEPAALGKGIISGRHINKNRAVYERLNESGGVVWAEDAGTLSASVIMLMESPSQRDRLNKAALTVYRSFTHQADEAARAVLSMATLS